MQLSRDEQIVAAHLMNRKGLDNRVIGERLHVTQDVAFKYVARSECPVDLDSLGNAELARMIGNPVPA